MLPAGEHHVPMGVDLPMLKTVLRAVRALS
jgi:hypothetical protein